MQSSGVNSDFDWTRVARLLLLSRQLEEIETHRLVPDEKTVYRFSATGHDLAQILLGTRLTHPHDAVSAYYRSRPLLLTLGLSAEDALVSTLGRQGGLNSGRDLGVVYNMPPRGSATVLPMAGDVGSQYTPVAGWAQAIEYHSKTLGESDYEAAIAVAHGGEGSVATNGFWSALATATTLRLPMLFYVEDNGFSISVPGCVQTPGGNIAENLSAFKNLQVLDGDGTDPGQASRLVQSAVDCVRSGEGPVLLRLDVPRLQGHSGQDTQAYKSAELLARERGRDPLPKLREYLVPGVLSGTEWADLQRDVEREAEQAMGRALERPEPEDATRYVFTELAEDGRPEMQTVGGLQVVESARPVGSDVPEPEGGRLSMVLAISRTLAAELETNPKILIFGEDVGAKGGIFGATADLQSRFGEERVFDTSLSEEGIVGRAIGMALAGLMPVVEIQFRKYADSATVQIHNCGTMRWRTANRFAAPLVVRMPGGFSRINDPWHSVCAEVEWVHAIGLQVAYPSNAEDAVGLLRTAMRGNDPTIFFEHRTLLNAPYARRPYPGDDFVVPFGRARTVQAGDELTVVTWGAMVERCVSAAEEVGRSIEILDLRTLQPWDRAAVLDSVSRTQRCLIVHEDTRTSGFGAEVAATVGSEAFFQLDAPVERMAMRDVPPPFNTRLLDDVLPTAHEIAAAMKRLIEL